MQVSAVRTTKPLVAKAVSRVFKVVLSLSTINTFTEMILFSLALLQPWDSVSNVSHAPGMTFTIDAASYPDASPLKPFRF